MAGIYIHIPFCKQACFYCDFHFSTNQRLKDEMVDAVATELFLQKHYLGQTNIDTIYFGGGTPSLLEDRQLQKVLGAIYDNYQVTESPEITLEANPDDLTRERLDSLYQVGVNRLSIGVQSFDNDVLAFLNRAHNAQEAQKCITEARNVGFKNISLDLIYAIPDRSHKQWEVDLSKALALKPEHISSYCLTIEPNTVFGRWQDKNKFTPVDDEIAAEQFEILLEVLNKNGYEQYEVSNFCLPGFESQHNSSYWKQEKYLGVGPSAHSYDLKNRQFNISHNKKYLDSIANGQVPFTLDELTIQDQINDYLLTTLRTKWGADLIHLARQFDYGILQNHALYIQQLIDEKKAIITDNRLILTQQGLLLADQISADLFT